HGPLATGDVPGPLPADPGAGAAAAGRRGGAEPPGPGGGRPGLPAGVSRAPRGGGRPFPPLTRLAGGAVPGPGAEDPGHGDEPVVLTPVGEGKGRASRSTPWRGAAHAPPPSPGFTVLCKAARPSASLDEVWVGRRGVSIIEGTHQGWLIPSVPSATGED